MPKGLLQLQGICLTKLSDLLSYDYYKVNHPFEVYHSTYKAPSEPFIYFYSGLFFCHLHDRHKWGQHAITFQKRFIIPWEEVYLDVFS